MKKGYTLIEVLICIAIIGLLVSLVFGVLNGPRTSITVLDKEHHRAHYNSNGDWESEKWELYVEGLNRKEKWVKSWVFVNKGFYLSVTNGQFIGILP